MKVLHANYTFSPGAGGAGTVQLTGLNITLDRILLINNATRNVIIYNFADTSSGAASYSQSANSVLTLTKSTTGHNAADKLLIYYDDGNAEVPTGSIDFAPATSFNNLGGDKPATDPDGNLVVRAQSLTDEGSWRANFSAGDLGLSIGTITLTNGSDVVSWSITSATDIRVGDYIKLDADSESAWAQICCISSQTGGTLVAAYAGTGGTGAGSRAVMKPVTGSGGTVAIVSGNCELTSGTTNNAITGVDRYSDFGPLTYRARVTASQRIANQTIEIGLRENAATPRWFARFELDGTTNTIVKCRSARTASGAPTASEIEETSITLPNGATTAAGREYRVELLPDEVRFLVDGIVAARHLRVVPMPHDEMTGGVRVVNATSVGSSTTVTIDYVTIRNHNRLEVGYMSEAETVQASNVGTTLFAYNVSGVITINTDLLIIDCAQFRALSINCVSMGATGVVTVQWSNDPAFSGTPITATLYDQAGATSTTFSASNILRITNVLGRYCRLRLTTATTSGTTTINVQGLQQAITPPITTQPVSGTVTANLASNSTITPIPQTSQGTSTGHRQSITTNITTGVPTNVKNSAGVIGLLTVANNCGTGVWFHLYNLASAPTMGSSTPEQSLFCPSAQVTQINTGPFGARFATGISYAICDNATTIPTAGGTITVAGGGSSIVVSMRYT